jgi:hypothetical protein
MNASSKLALVFVCSALIAGCSREQPQASAAPAAPQVAKVPGRHGRLSLSLVLGLLPCDLARGADDGVYNAPVPLKIFGPSYRLFASIDAARLRVLVPWRVEIFHVPLLVLHDDLSHISAPVVSEERRPHRDQRGGCLFGGSPTAATGLRWLAAGLDNRGWAATPSLSQVGSRPTPLGKIYTVFAL